MTRVVYPIKIVDVVEASELNAIDAACTSCLVATPLPPPVTADGYSAFTSLMLLIALMAMIRRKAPNEEHHGDREDLPNPCA